MSVDGSSRSNGAHIIQWSCIGAEAQLWQLEWLPDTQIFQIRNLRSDKCVSIANDSTANGAQLIQWTCQQKASQLWFDNPVGGAIELRSLHVRSKCISVNNAVPDNGAKIILWGCAVYPATSPYQQWY